MNRLDVYSQLKFGHWCRFIIMIGQTTACHRLLLWQYFTFSWIVQSKWGYTYCYWVGWENVHLRWVMVAGNMWYVQIQITAFPPQFSFIFGYFSSYKMRFSQNHWHRLRSHDWMNQFWKTMLEYTLIIPSISALFIPMKTMVLSHFVIVFLQIYSILNKRISNCCEQNESFWINSGRLCMVGHWSERITQKTPAKYKNLYHISDVQCGHCFMRLLPLLRR